jgi:hypothetical protein
MHPLEPQNDVGHDKSSFETVLVLVLDRCMVCTKYSISSVIILDAPDGTPTDDAQVKARFGSFGDSANLDAR